jgi:hypothetical protein
VFRRVLATDPAATAALWTRVLCLRRTTRTITEEEVAVVVVVVAKNLAKDNTREKRTLNVVARKN